MPEFFTSARRDLVSIVALCESGRNKADGKKNKQDATVLGWVDMTLFAGFTDAVKVSMAAKEEITSHNSRRCIKLIVKHVDGQNMVFPALFGAEPKATSFAFSTGGALVLHESPSPVEESIRIF